MSELGQEVLDAAQSRIDASFRHHFKPENLCDSGAVTIDRCMERGMDLHGYDCSGLAIASICDVLDIPTSDWPWQFRHVFQLARLTTSQGPLPGDLQLYDFGNNRRHLGIATATDEVIHASGASRTVERSVVTAREYNTTSIRVIAIESLGRLFK